MPTSSLRRAAIRLLSVSTCVVLGAALLHAVDASADGVVWNGVLRAADGTPVAGAELTASGSGWSTPPLTTDGDGAFSLDVLSGQVLVSIQSSGADTAGLGLPNTFTIRGQTTVNGNLTQDIDLPAPIDLTVAVVDGANNPLQDATVNIGAQSVPLLPSGIFTSGTNEFATGTTGPDGTVVHRAFPFVATPVSRVNLHATRAVGDFTLSGNLTIPTGQFDPAVYVTADSTYTVKIAGGATAAVWNGVLRNANGIPVPGARLLAGGPGGPTTTITGADGAFVAEVAVGQVSMQIQSDGADLSGFGLPDSFSIYQYVNVSTDLTRDIVLPAAITLTAAVVDTSNVPVAGALVRGGGPATSRLTIPGGTYGGSFGLADHTTGADGTTTYRAFPFTASNTNPFSIRATRTLGPFSVGSGIGVPSVPRSADVPVTADTTYTLTIPTATIATWTGVLRAATGAPVAGAELTVSSGGGATDVITDADGSFATEVLTGTSAVQVRSATADTEALGLPSSFTLNGQIQTAADLTQDLVLPAPITLTASVVDAANNPISGATVRGTVGSTARLAISGSFYGGSFGLGEHTTGTDGTTTYRAFPFTATNLDRLSFTTSRVVGPFTLSGGLTVPSGFRPPDTPITTDTAFIIPIPRYGELASAGSMDGTITVIVAGATQVSAMSATSVPGDLLPSGAVALTGVVSYTLSGGMAIGGSSDVTMLLPADSNPNAVFKLIGGSYVDVTSLATITGDTIVLHLTDGGLGDEDELANGTIIDPVIPVRIVAPLAPALGAITFTATSATVPFTPGGDGGRAIIDSTATCGSTDGGATATATSATSPITITGLTPGRTYTCAVVSRNNIGTGAPATSPPFRVPALGPVPEIRKLDANSGPGAGGTKVTIAGRNFRGATSVTFGGVLVSGFTVNKDGTEIKVTTPSHIAGVVDVVVTNANGSNLASATARFTYLGPAVTKLDPTSGRVAGGTKVTIKGRNLQGATAIVFGDRPVTSFTVDKDGTEIKVVTPTHAAGAVNVRITTPGGTSPITSSATFTYR